MQRNLFIGLLFIPLLACGGSNKTGAQSEQNFTMDGTTVQNSTVTGEQVIRQAIVATVEIQAPPADPQGLVVEFDAAALAVGSMSPVKVRIPSITITERKDMTGGKQNITIRDSQIKSSKVTSKQLAEQSANMRRLEVTGGTARNAPKVDEIEVPKQQVYDKKEDATAACQAPSQVVALKESGPFLCVPKEALTAK